MFTVLEKVYMIGLLVGGFICLKCTHTAMDRWEEDMKKQVAIINEKTKLAQKGVII